jgi:hypothetical protein
VILTENFEKLEEIAAVLLEKEVLEGSEFNELLGLPVQDVTAETKVGDAETSPTDEPASNENGEKQESPKV